MAASRKRLLSQIATLSRKNLIITRRQWLFNLFRCLIAPVLLAWFIARAPQLFSPPLKLGLGEVTTIPNLVTSFRTGKLIWADLTGNTGSSPSLEAQEVMSLITEGFDEGQMSRVIRISHADDLVTACPPNFQQVSDCFGAVLFDSPFTSRPLHYTILSNIGEFPQVDVENHVGVIETKLFPLQWAVDKALIRFSGGAAVGNLQAPHHRAYTRERKEDKLIRMQASFLRGIKEVTVLGLVAGLFGVVFHLAGSVMSEHSESLTAYLDVMGAKPLARILSGYLSISILHMPSWVIMAIFWQKHIFVSASFPLILSINILSGLLLASWTLNALWLFVRAPSLAALGCSTLAMVLSMLGLTDRWKPMEAILLIVVFPPSFFTLAIRSVARWGLAFRVLNIKSPDTSGITLYTLLVAGTIAIFVHLAIAYVLDDWMSGRGALRRSWHRKSSQEYSNDTAIVINNLSVVHKTSTWLAPRNPPVVAAENFSLSIAKAGIHVLCGTNGSGKTSILECVCGLRAPTKGSISYGKDAIPLDSKHTLGVVPQRDVLWPELTVLEHVEIWNSVKSEGKDDCGTILMQCDLWDKRHRQAQFLSGGEKRKLQLAIALIGGSKTLIIDEVSSAVDPISRRLIQNTLLSVKADRAILMTTHHLDEAEIIADSVILVAPPGRILRTGSPALLKQEVTDLNGYCLQLHFPARSHFSEAHSDGPTEALSLLKGLLPGSSMREDGLLRLGTSDPSIVSKALRLLDSKRSMLGHVTVDVRHATLEDVFLAATAESGQDMSFLAEGSSKRLQTRDSFIHRAASPRSPLPLTHSSTRSLIKTLKSSPTFALVKKRLIISSRQWSIMLFALLLAVGTSYTPTRFFAHRSAQCYLEPKLGSPIPMFIKKSPFFARRIFSLRAFPVIDPPDSLPGLGIKHTNVSASSTFMDTMVNGKNGFYFGGAQLTSPNQTTIVWEAGLGNPAGPTLLNIVSNYIADTLKLSDSNVPFLSPDFAFLPEAPSRGLGDSIKWMAFMGTAMAVYPIISALYVTKERLTGVKSMQLSNGFSPSALWSGHLMAELPLILAIATAVVFLFEQTGQFSNFVLLWLVMVIYGLTASAFAFVASLLMDSPIIAFIMAAMYQEATVLGMVSGYLWTTTQLFTFEDPPAMLDKLHAVLGAIAPAPNIVRATFLAGNTYWEFCDESGRFNPSRNVLAFNRFGGPLLYLTLQTTLLFSFLVAYDSGWFDELGSWRARLQHLIRPRRIVNGEWSYELVPEDSPRSSRNAPLQVVGISKTHSNQHRRTLDNVSFTVRNGIFALLGPNGAGKSTLFNIIQGYVSPDSSPARGDVVINGISMFKDPAGARSRLGVCLQANTLDEHLTVEEHLRLYAMCHNVDERRFKDVLEATRLDNYRSRLAGALSGGNKASQLHYLATALFAY
ncbi:hypothetical protein FRC03_012765 [Tulasnella sp. 419]|nr:hypothetical protein FRC03_012765 [Tulasnella sp. 419]